MQYVCIVVIMYSYLLIFSAYHSTMASVSLATDLLIAHMPPGLRALCIQLGACKCTDNKGKARRGAGSHT